MANVLAKATTVGELLKWIEDNVVDMDAPVVIGVEADHEEPDFPYDYRTITTPEFTGLTVMGGRLTTVLTSMDDESVAEYGLPEECIDPTAPEALVLWSC